MKIALCSILLTSIAFSEHGTLSPQLPQWAAEIEFAGAVSRGEEYQYELPAHNLAFRLTPAGNGTEDSGWTISVRQKDHSPASDLVYVATPPYRMDNPRYLFPSHGRSAEETVEWNPRQFRFVLDEKTAREAIGKVAIFLWKYDYTEQEFQEARAFLDEMKCGEGVLMILGSRTGGYGEESYISFLEFKVQLKIPE